MSGQRRHPLLKADEVEAAFTSGGHFLWAPAKMQKCLMSDLVGINDLGVRKIKLEPGAESTCIHYHFAESEWMYIISGSGELQTVDTQLRVQKTRQEVAEGPNPSFPKQYEIKVTAVGAGDFMGFQCGTGAQEHAHGLRAGPQGLVYLCGGSRSPHDVCVYPLVGRTVMYNHTAVDDAMLLPGPQKVSMPPSITFGKEPPRIVDGKHHPLVKAAEVEENYKVETHYLWPPARAETSPLADIVGINDLGVSKVRLAPGAESTCIHYHLNESEWMYILSGGGVLQLVDTKRPIQTTHDEVKQAEAASALGDFNIEELPVSPGDFMGFQAGPDAQRYAHGLKAGPQGMEYICGGNRRSLKTTVYPLVGKVVAYDTEAKRYMVMPGP